MTADEQLETLKKKHQELSKRVEEEQMNPAVDYLHIAKLKKQKLYLKEQIVKLS